MEQVSNNELSAFEEATGDKINGTINVLTILTFIGSALQLIMVFVAKWLMSFAFKMADNPEVMEKMSAKDREQMQLGKQAFEAYVQYEIPLVIISLVGIGLCVYGAIQMRKLKKQGFYAYVIGEWMPLIGSTSLMGFGLQFSGGASSIIFSLAEPLLFTVLYALQLKRLK